MCGGNSTSTGQLQLFFNLLVSSTGINGSFIPWINEIGHFILFTFSKDGKALYTKLPNIPAMFLATSTSDENALTTNKALGQHLEAKLNE